MTLEPVSQDTATQDVPTVDSETEGMAARDMATQGMRAAANPSATADEVKAAFKDPKLANVLYHDWEAGTYDEKWSISYDERCITYASDRFRAVAGDVEWPYGRALELGCGTGFFLLNLIQAGVMKEGAVTDISPGMVEVAQRNAEGLGFEVEGKVADAESLPFPDDSFDLVVGHAVLHHIPDLALAMREVMRVLRPGGRFVFAGEPTEKGDTVARLLSRATWWVASRVTQMAPEGRTRGILARRPVGGGGGRPHLRSGRVARPVPGCGRGGGRYRHRGTHSLLVRLADKNV